VQRCCGAATTAERRDACFLLSTLLWHRLLAAQALTPYLGVLKKTGLRQLKEPMPMASYDDQ